MSAQEFANLKNAIATKFLTEYEGERVDQNGVAELTEQTQNLGIWHISLASTRQKEYHYEISNLK